MKTVWIFTLASLALSFGLPTEDQQVYKEGNKESLPQENANQDISLGMVEDFKQDSDLSKNDPDFAKITEDGIIQATGGFIPFEEDIDVDIETESGIIDDTMIPIGKAKDEKRIMDVLKETEAEYFGTDGVPEYVQGMLSIEELAEDNRKLREQIQYLAEQHGELKKQFENHVGGTDHLKYKLGNLESELDYLSHQQTDEPVEGSSTNENRVSQNETGEYEVDTASNGALYVRWGRDDCPSSADKVYDGVVAGGRSDHTGGGANYLCLPKTPIYSATTGGGNYEQARAHVYGIEYEIVNFPPFRHVHEHDPPCAVCQSKTRSQALMVPARNDCPGGWSREYYSYLMSAHWEQKRAEFVCVDRNPEARPGTGGESRGGNWFNVEGRCTSGGGIPCGPYVSGKEFTCAVCTK